jgi:hypothetical protein
MTLRRRRIVIGSLLAALAFEAITCALRFGLGLQSTRDTSTLARFTFGLRIHHGYAGVALLIGCAFLKPSRLRDGLIIAGIGLAASDLVHHFVVLWLVTGDPRFDLFYG